MNAPVRRAVRSAAASAAIAVGAACGATTSPGTHVAPIVPVPTVETQTATPTPSAPPQSAAATSPATTATPTGSGTAATSAPPAITLQQVIDAASAIYPRSATGTYFECDQGGGAADFSRCRVTSRLRTRLEQIVAEPNGGGAGKPLCRCLNPSTSLAVTPELTNAGASAHVTLFGGAVHIDLVMVLTSGELLVDDTRCTAGGVATSVYNDPLVTCA